MRVSLGKCSKTIPHKGRLIFLDKFAISGILHLLINWLWAGVAQLAEHKLPKLGVAGSSPVARSM